MENAIEVDIWHTPVFDKTKASTAKVVVNAGGAGSSKSYSAYQLMIERFLEFPCTIGVTRKTFPALRRTAYDGVDGIIKLLKRYGIYGLGTHNKTFNTFTFRQEWFPPGEYSVFDFFGMDEPEKLKSTTFHYILAEEANEFTYDDISQLRLRLRGKRTDGGRNQIYLCLNPIDENNWIPKRLLKKDEDTGLYEDDVDFIHSTYKDNLKFLSQDYIDDLISAQDRDENYYRVYTLGLWGNLEGLIYKNFDEVDEIPEGEGWAYGLDFGLTSPMALVKATVKDREVYLEEIIYKRGLKISDVIEKLSHIEHGDIYADPSGPSKLIIEEIVGAGYRCYPGAKSVSHSIDLCKRTKFHVLKSSTELLKELRGYQWMFDKKLDDYIDKPVKYNDHACDAMRYAMYGLAEKYGFATASRNMDFVTIQEF